MAANANPSSAPVSGRALAKPLGVTEGAVRCARDTGRLRRSVLPRKRFDPALAMEEWQAATDPRQQRRTKAATDAAADAKRAKGKAAPARGRAARAAPPLDPRPEDDLDGCWFAHTFVGDQELR